MIDMQNEYGIVPTTPTALPDVVLAKLNDYATAARGAFSHSTVRALRADTKILMTWCEAHGVTFLPMAPSDMARFIDSMAEQRSPATVARYVSSAARLHRAAELHSPTEHESVRLALRRMWRGLGRSQKQAEALNRRLIDRLLSACGTTPRELRNAALLAVAYDSMARRSELVALRVEDMSVDADGHGSILICRSKTDQEGHGSSRYLAPGTVRSVRAWLDRAGIGHGPLFQAVVKSGRATGQAMDARKIPLIYKEMAGKAGLSAAEIVGISGHSTRIGCAQDQSASGLIGITSIMESGGWRTPRMVAHYTRRQASRRSGSARLAELQNRSS